MSDIAMAGIQDAIADSLVSGPPSHVMGTNPENGEVSLLTLEQAGLIPEEVTWEPGATEPTVKSFEPEPEEDAEYRTARDQVEREPQMEYGQHEDLASEGEAELQEFQEQQKAPQESQVEQQPIEPYSQTVERLNLKSPEADEGLAEGLQDILQLAPGAGVNAPQMGDLMRITALSAAQHGMQESINPEVAQAWTEKMYAAFGIDPRFSYELAPEQQQGMALTVHNAFANIEDTCQMLEARGIKPTVESINRDPLASLLFFNQFCACASGAEVPIDPAMAIKVGDAIAGFFLDMRNRAYASQPKPRAESRSTGSSRNRNRIPKMQSNTDLFDTDTLERIANERML